MSTLARTIRSATRRAAEEEDKDVDTTTRKGEQDDDKAPAAETEEDEVEEDEDKPSAETDEEDEAEEEEEKPSARRSARRRGAARGYSLADARQTLELCAIAGTSAKRALDFVRDRTSLAKVRSVLTEGGPGAHASIDPAARTPSATAGWDNVVAKVNAQAGVGGRR